MKIVTLICFILGIVAESPLAFGADMTVQGIPPKCGITLNVSKTDEDRFFVVYRLDKNVLEVEECQCPVSSRILRIHAEGDDPDAATGSYELSADMVSAELDLTLPKLGTYVASVRCACEKCLKPAGMN
jgi:hypothetical protein